MSCHISQALLCISVHNLLWVWRDVPATQSRCGGSLFTRSSGRGMQVGAAFSDCLAGVRQKYLGDSERQNTTLVPMSPLWNPVGVELPRWFLKQLYCFLFCRGNKWKSSVSGKEQELRGSWASVGHLLVLHFSMFLLKQPGYRCTVLAKGTYEELCSSYTKPGSWVPISLTG